MENDQENFERTPPQQRRILRQSTLPNPDSALHVLGHSNSLKIPSPKQQVSPQYSPYHTDNENEDEPSTGGRPPKTQIRIRRQSTLPCTPNDHHGQNNFYLSTSPNRNTGMYSRSPEKPTDVDHSRYPPFVRQATFPANINGDTQFQMTTRHLPTSPNRMHISKSPDSETEQVSPRRFFRQSTLPNPDQQMKLLPTSPPKKPQLSPNFKRSPEFQRQNTLPNPEGMSTLSVHQHGPKFLPISPRQKLNFLFPQPAPRPFLSQQHFPSMVDEQHQPPSSAAPHRDHSKMIKVRSHSNEEYSFNRPYGPTEGRRLLPEIPSNRSPKLVRQEHVREDQNADKRSPILKTFAEAKQTLNDNNEYQDYQVDYQIEYDQQGQPFEMQTVYNNEYNDLNTAFAEADETNYVDEENYDSYDNVHDNKRYDGQLAESVIVPKNKTTHTIRSAESFLNDSSPEYFQPDEYIKALKKDRNRRRKSRDLPIEPQVIISSNEEVPKRKPETMRSVSEESAPRVSKIVPRRSLSHPEKETQAIKTDSPTIPNPKLLSDLLAKRIPKLPSPRRFKLGSNKAATTDQEPAEESVPIKPVYRFQKMLEKRGDSKSFDAVVKQVIKSEIDPEDKSQSMDENLFMDGDVSILL